MKYFSRKVKHSIRILFIFFEILEIEIEVISLIDYELVRMEKDVELFDMHNTFEICK